MVNDLTNIFVQIPSYIFWKNTNSVFLGCNNHFALAAGLGSPKDIIGKTDFDLIWGESHADLYRQGDQEVLDGCLKINIREPQLKSNGKIATILINKTPLMDAKNQKIGVIGNYLELVDPKWTGKFDSTKPNVSLSPRQAECLYFLALGMNVKQIASAIEISTRTAEHHVAVLKQKFSCRLKSELIAKALSLDFIKARLLGLS